MLILCQLIVLHLLCSLMEDWFGSNSSCIIMSLLSSMAALNRREKLVIVWFSKLRFLVESSQHFIPSLLSCRKIKKEAQCLSIHGTQIHTHSASSLPDITNASGCGWCLRLLSVMFFLLLSTQLSVVPYYIVKTRVNICINEWLHKIKGIYIMEFYYNLRCYQCLNIAIERMSMSKNH